MWDQQRNRKPMLELITPGRAVASRYMEWFYANGKPFIMTPEARARVLRVSRPKRPRQQRGPRSIGASVGSRHQTGGPSISAGPGLAAEGPSTEPYTPMPPVFSHASSSQFQSPVTPPTEGFCAGAFQPYSLMITALLHSLGHFLPPPHHQWHHYQCIHRSVLISVLAMGWINIHPHVHYLPLDRVGAVMTPMTMWTMIRLRRRRTTTTTMHLFEEIPAETVVHQLVGPGDIGDIRPIYI
ncbi:hypothetical protein V6N13_018974 [Hibiscus sabdariffa]